MFNQLKSLLGKSSEDELPLEIDKNIAAAALMVHVIAVDGKITTSEEQRLSAVLREHYAVSTEEAKTLAASAKKAQSEAIDLYTFTSVLKRAMNVEERRALIEDLWEMVFADGKVHEFEDNVVWRVAELIGIQSRERMNLKQRVLERSKSAIRK